MPLEELSYEECIEFLRDRPIGRLAVVVDRIPIVLPVNCRLVETLDQTLLALRTRPGKFLDQPPASAASL